jgi:hypothetical protein
MHFFRTLASIFVAATILSSPVTAQQNPAPSTPMITDQKPSPSTTPEQQKGVDDYLKSKSGQGGKQEPSASANETPAYAGPVLVNGILNVAGAPKDSQTVPSKYSSRNDSLDLVGRIKN